MQSSGCFHFIQRSDRFWTWLTTDLRIDHVIMRALKSRGGLSHGHGMAESVWLLWVNSMHKCATTCIYAASATLIINLDESDETLHAEIGPSQ